MKAATGAQWAPEKRWLLYKDRPQTLSTYHPLSMLGPAEKLIEKVINPGLTDAICATRDFSPKQCAFSVERSANDAIEEVMQAVT